MEQSRLRVGGWVDHLSDPSSTPTSGAGSAPDLPSIDPVGDLTGELDLGAWEPDDEESYRGRRRYREARVASPQRVALVAILVGAMLLGIGLMSRTVFGSDPEPLTAPPPLPEHTRAAPTEAEARLGLAPAPEASGQPDQPGGGDQEGGATSPGDSTSQPASPPRVQADYEAEHATLGGQASTESFEGASGGEVVRLWGSGGHVEFTGVAVQQAGSFTLTILYSGGSRTVQVSVNGDSVPHTLPATSDGTIAAASLSIDLVSGGNTIRISTSAGPPFYLDGITVG